MGNRTPSWCPHQNCSCKVSLQDKMCGGELPGPDQHLDDFNTHRICFDTRKTGHGIFDLMINKSDKFWIIRLLNGTIEDTQ